MSELLHGVHRADSHERRARRSEFVEQILEIIPSIPFDVAVAREHAAVRADLSVRGVPIGPHDSMIAATCIAHHHAVLTTNTSEFGRVPNLTVVSFELE